MLGPVAGDDGKAAGVSEVAAADASAVSKADSEADAPAGVNAAAGAVRNSDQTDGDGQPPDKKQKLATGQCIDCKKTQ